MTSPPLDSTHGQQRQAWHDIPAFGQHTRSDFRRDMRSPPLNNTQSNDVGRGMPSSPLGSTHGRTTSGVACHHSPWTANTVERRRAWQPIIAIGLAHTVGRRRAWHAIIALGQHRRSDGVGRHMKAQTVGRHRAWHSIIALGQHKRSAVVGRACTQRSAVACPHRSWLA